ncbi:uncharacterized protein EV422DRAFT_581226 [Fimicolochytrium jonesii]|uniref:uncharacterized protein n=1 Tax=Fimicolochytrium jonesii TaxID=1396493 RepID=UPI0022FDDF1E|nr:uncharacterized protein EV422DRAFT_581226 [Fimicolochytrium jonesii]KAI8816690.1 hypothetical protein EV422DRAFT_581226 [Fimicolochytrium jonesii]
MDFAEQLAFGREQAAKRFKASQGQDREHSGDEVTVRHQTPPMPPTRQAASSDDGVAVLYHHLPTPPARQKAKVDKGKRNIWAIDQQCVDLTNDEDWCPQSEAPPLGMSSGLKRERWEVDIGTTLKQENRNTELGGGVKQDAWASGSRYGLKQEGWKVEDGIIPKGEDWSRLLDAELNQEGWKIEEGIAANSKQEGGPASESKLGQITLINHRPEAVIPNPAPQQVLASVDVEGSLYAEPPLLNEQRLLDYQEPHVDHMLGVFARGNRGIDASETGTGKTYCTIEMAQRLKLRPFIICPKSVILSWIDVAKKFEVELLGIAGYEQLRGCRYFTGGTLDSADSPYIRKQHIQREEPEAPQDSNEPYRAPYHVFEFGMPSDAMFVFDEVKIAPTTGWIDVCLAMRPSANASSRSRRIAIFLRNTLNYGAKFSPNSLAAKAIPTGCADNSECAIRSTISREEEERKVDVFHRALTPRFGHRIRIADLGDRFAKNETSCKLQQLYEEIKAIFEELRDKELRASALARLIRARQKIEILRIPIFVESAEMYSQEGFSVVIFTNYTETLTQLQGKLECEYVVHGPQTMEERAAAVDAFQQNRTNLISCNIQAGGVGLSLHDVHGGHPRVALFNPTWSGQDMVQGLGRIRRTGGKSPTRQFILFVGGTYEERISQLVQQKMAILRG